MSLRISRNVDTHRPKPDCPLPDATLTRSHSQDPSPLSYSQDPSPLSHVRAALQYKTRPRCTGYLLSRERLTFTGKSIAQER